MTRTDRGCCEHARLLRRTTRGWPLAAVALSCAWLAGGCGGPPQVQPENRRLVEAVLTAVSARNPEWLEMDAALLEKQRAAGRVKEDEYKAFAEILRCARAGQWDAAEDAAYALRDIQRLTSEDLARLPEFARAPGD